jgi:hypothetical protein
MRMRNCAWTIGAALFVALWMPVCAGAQSPGDQPQIHGRLIEFDAPLAAPEVSTACGAGCGTQALANNDFGVVVGFYTDKKVVEHGFFRTPFGQIVSFDAPQAGLEMNGDDGTVAYSINDLGVIVGAVQDSSNVQHGFIRYVDGSFRNFDVKGAGTAKDTVCAPYCGTYALSVNLQGAVAGIYVDGNDGYHGFVRQPDGEVQSFDPAGSVFTYVCEETCINEAGTVTGYYEDSIGTHGFIRDSDGAITTVDAPESVSTISGSINVEGGTTGYYVGTDGLYHGYTRTRDGAFVPINAPGASGPGTASFSINSLGAVTGEYFDTNFVMHGFEQFADGSVGEFDAPGAGSGGGQGTRPSTNNLEGEVAGWRVDGAGLNHGFVWVP